MITWWEVVVYGISVSKSSVTWNQYWFIGGLKYGRNTAEHTTCLGTTGTQVTLEFKRPQTVHKPKCLTLTTPALVSWLPKNDVTMIYCVVRCMIGNRLSGIWIKIVRQNFRKENVSENVEMVDILFKPFWMRILWENLVMTMAAADALVPSSARILTKSKLQFFLEFFFFNVNIIEDACTRSV